MSSVALVVRGAAPLGAGCATATFTAGRCRGSGARHPGALMIVNTRRLEWDAMHRIPGHEGKCRAFHGHRYVAEITCAAPTLDALGRVVDFGVIKQRVGTWIDENWDHTAILAAHDTDPAAEAIDACKRIADCFIIICKRKHYS